MTRYRMLSAVGLAAATFTFAACGDDDNGAASSSGGGRSLTGTINGAGASAQEAAQQAWTAGFQEAHSGATVTYDPVGSGGGREQFLAGGTDFAGSDAALKDDEVKTAAKVCGTADNVIEIPAYVSPIAVIYNLEGVDGLELSAATIAKIFDGKITKWNDVAIKAENPDADLPDSAITPVHRSDESGTTENFTEYLSAAAASDWKHEPSGDWPTKSGESAQGTSGVVDAVTNGAGAIGYADASQAGELGVVQVKLTDSAVGPTPEAAAKIIEESERTAGTGRYRFTYDLNRTPESDAYPIVLVSYLIGCAQQEDAAKADLIKGYFDYIISPEGQDKAAENAGSAPMSNAVRELVKPAVDAIKAGA